MNRYLSVHDAYRKEFGSDVSLYAVVMETEGPRSTSGSDYHMVVKIADPSVGSIDASYTYINVNLFSKRKEHLPEIRRPGDVVRITHLKVGKWQGNPQLTAKVGKGAGDVTERCQFLVFDGGATLPVCSRGPLQGKTCEGD
jgi:hypothetical protein